MANKVRAIPVFERKYKRFLKKFSSLEQEVDDLIAKLKANPTLGVSLGSGLYKIRLASRSKGGGKSGGFRVVTYLIDEREDGIDIYLVTIFDKSEESSIDKKVLVKIVKRLFG
ncbi:type II toxin-antitoxin system RelE/ParE family toxin [Salmonirosea aquatica]|uniref:Addiction module toxin RelE n=1 Tax=Salmonirosea aquatica TaxID=2654236 RepID=A0A7C9BRW4_9BACT|nr:addiction module toxin RelE [Cytophagaceae bacterium SJW1-29]